MTTLIEFLQPVATGTHTDRCLAVLLYAEMYEEATYLTTAEVSHYLIDARVPRARNINVSGALLRGRHFVDSVVGDSRNRTWHLTASGETYIRNRLGISPDDYEVVNNAGSLRAAATKIQDEIVRGYIDESIKCLEVGALRAAIVFMWSGTIRILQETCISSYSTKQIDAALQVHDPKAKSVTRIESFASIKDVTQLLLFRELGMFDKGQWTTLGEALSLRNRCGHPTNYKPGIKKASSFVEDLLSIVF